MNQIRKALKQCPWHSQESREFQNSEPTPPDAGFFARSNPEPVVEGSPFSLTREKVGRHSLAGDRVISIFVQ